MTLIATNLFPAIFPRLNVAEVDVVEDAAGPGRRLVIWLQGCLKRCPGCANGPFLPQHLNRVTDVKRLLDQLDRNQGLSGVTLSGGDPVLQAAALIPFLEAVRQRELTVVCYTGYTLDELRAPGNEPELARFLDCIDLLIDGEYRQELARAGTYRPSSNQQLHFLSGRISPESCENKIETVFNMRGGRAIATGTLPMSVRRDIFERLHREGISLKLILSPVDSGDRE